MGASKWSLLLTLDGFEWWAIDDSSAPGGAVVWRRRESSWNVVMPDGTPGGVRREGSLAWWRRMMGMES